MIRCILLLLGLCAGFSLGVQAGPGDIRIQITDMEDRPISGAQGAQASLEGMDNLGWIRPTTWLANDQGEVVIPASFIQTNYLASFQFAVHTVVGTNQVRAHLHDPFGQAGSLIRYDGNEEYQFTVPTPTAGSAKPQITWVGTNSTLTFAMDLGNRTAADFWFTRVVLQKRAPNTNWLGSAYGVIPVIPATWLREHGYSLDDTNLPLNAVDIIKISKPGYEQTYFGRKFTRTPDSETNYLFYLVNCRWSNDLRGSYDATAKTYTATFDPMQVFLDANAPAYDGPAMKGGQPYFAFVQASVWLPHPAGARFGLAIEWGGGAANSLWFPFRINDQSIRLLVPGSQPDGFPITVYANMGLTYSVETTTNLLTNAWTTLLSTNPTVTPFTVWDRSPWLPRKFYRISTFQ